MGNASGNLNQRPSYYSVEYLNGSIGVGSANENINNYDYSTGGYAHDFNHTGSSNDLEKYNTKETRKINSSLRMKNYSLNCLDKLENFEKLDHADSKSINDEPSYETLNYYMDTNEKKYTTHRSNSELLTTANRNQIRTGMNAKNATNMLGLVRNGGVFVQRSKSYVRPENRVLPRELPTKPLRQTNLLKNDGYKRTWRNKATVKKNNSTLAIPTCAEQSRNNIAIKPSLIKSLQSQNSIDYLKQLNLNMNNFNNNIKQAVSCKDLEHNDATSNDEASDFDENVDAYSEIGPSLSKQKENEVKLYTDDDDDDANGYWSSKKKKQAISYSVENLNNEIKNFRDKYSRSMSNMDEEEEWQFDDKLGVDLKEEIFSQFGLKDKDESNKNEPVFNINSKSKPKISFKLNNDELNQTAQSQKGIVKETKKKMSKLSSWSLSIKEKKKPINKTNSIKTNSEKENENIKADKVKSNSKKTNTNITNKRDMNNSIDEHEHAKLSQELAKHVNNINSNPKLGHKVEINKKEQEQLKLQKKKLKSKSFINQIKSYKPMSSKTEQIVVKHPYENGDYLLDLKNLRERKNEIQVKLNNNNKNSSYDDFEILPSNMIKSKASTSSSLSTSSVSISPPPTTRPPPTSTSPPHSNLPNKSPSKLVNRIKSINRPQFGVKHKNSTNNQPNNSPIKANNRLNENLINHSNDIQIISRFPINSKVYRHYIAGNGNKIDKLTNSIDISNMIKTKSTCLNDILNNNKTNKSFNHTNIISFKNDNDLISANERAIDVVFESNDCNLNQANLNFKSNSAKSLAKKKSFNDFDTIYDSIEEYNSSASSSSSSTSSSNQDQAKDKMNSSSISSSSPASTSLLSPTSSSSDYYYKALNDETNENNSISSPNHLQPLNQRKKLSDKVNQQDFNIRSSITSSSVLSALTSSSLVQPASNFDSQSRTNNKQDGFVSSVNVSFNSSFSNNYNNNMANLKKGFNSSKINSSFDEKNELRLEECNYEMLANANSAQYALDNNKHKRFINVSNSGSPCKVNLEPEHKAKKKFIPEETKRLNERFQDEIQKAYEERTKRFNQVKIALQSNPSWLCDLNNLKNINQNKISSRKSFNEFENENIDKKLKQPQPSIQKSPSFLNAFKQSNQSAFTKPNSNSNIKPTANKSLVDIPSFYLKPPSVYGDNASSKEKLNQEQEISIRVPVPKNNLSRARSSSSSNRINENNFHFRQQNPLAQLNESKSNNITYQPEFNSEIIEFPPPPIGFKNTIAVDYKKKLEDKQLNESNERLIPNENEIGESRRKSTYLKTKNNSNFILRPKLAEDSANFNNEPILTNCIDNINKNDEQIPALIIIEQDNKAKLNETPSSDRNTNRNKPSRSVSKSRRKGLEEIFPDIKITRQSSMSAKDLNIESYDSINDKSSNFYQAKNLTDDYASIYNLRSTLKINNKPIKSKSVYELSNGIEETTYSSQSRIDDPNWCPASDLYDFDVDESDDNSCNEDNNNNNNNNKNTPLKILKESPSKAKKDKNDIDDSIKVHKFDYSKLNKNNFNCNNHSFEKLKNDILQPIGNLNIFYY